jgi:hypothetical protein
MAASAARVGMQAFNTVRVSSTTAGGRGGKALKGCSGTQVMMTFQGLTIRVHPYVVASDMLRKRGDMSRFLRHVPTGRFGQQ